MHTSRRPRVRRKNREYDKSSGGGTASVGDSRSAYQLAAKALALGSVIESAGPGDNRLDNLFIVYGGLAQVFMESGRPTEQREAEALKQLARFHNRDPPE